MMIENKNESRMADDKTEGIIPNSLFIRDGKTVFLGVDTTVLLKNGFKSFLKRIFMMISETKATIKNPNTFANPCVIEKWVKRSTAINPYNFKDKTKEITKLAKSSVALINPIIYPSYA